MIKEIKLSKIQILNEREPWAAQHGQVVVRWAMLLNEGLQEIGRLDDYASMLTPDTDHTAWTPSDEVFTSIGFTPPAAAAKNRVSALCVADHTPLVKARWKVASAREVIRGLREQRGLAALLVQARLLTAQDRLLTAQAELAAMEGPPDLSLHQETRFNLAEVLPDGQIQVRLRKCICENGEVISPPTYHRFVLHPGGPHAATLAGINSARAMGGGAPPMTQSDMERILRICTTDHTPERITAWQAAEAARRR